MKRALPVIVGAALVIATAALSAPLAFADEPPVSDDATTAITTTNATITDTDAAVTVDAAATDAAATDTDAVATDTDAVATDTDAAVTDTDAAATDTDAVATDTDAAATVDDGAVSGASLHVAPDSMTSVVSPVSGTPYIEFEFIVTNTGAVPLSHVAIEAGATGAGDKVSLVCSVYADPSGTQGVSTTNAPEADNVTLESIPVGAHAVCSMNIAVPASAKAVTYPLTVSVTAQDPQGAAVTPDASSVLESGITMPAFHSALQAEFTLSTGPAGSGMSPLEDNAIVPSKATIYVSTTLYNTGTTTLTNVRVAEPTSTGAGALSSLDCTGYLLPAGSTPWAAPVRSLVPGLTNGAITLAPGDSVTCIAYASMAKDEGTTVSFTSTGGTAQATLDDVSTSVTASYGDSDSSSATLSVTVPATGVGANTGGTVAPTSPLGAAAAGFIVLAGVALCVLGRRRHMAAIG